jgi:hypothetical protein
MKKIKQCMATGMMTTILHYEKFAFVSTAFNKLLLCSHFSVIVAALMHKPFDVHTLRHSSSLSSLNY